MEKNIKSSNSFSSYKVFLLKQVKGKPQIIINEEAKSYFSQNILKLIEFYYNCQNLYNSLCEISQYFSQFHTDIYPETKSKLKISQESISSEITETEKKIKSLEKMLENELSKEELWETAKHFQTFTEIEYEFLYKIEVKASYYEAKERTTMEIQFLNEYLDSLFNKKRYLEEICSYKFKCIVEEVLDLKKCLNEIQNIQADFANFEGFEKIHEITANIPALKEQTDNVNQIVKRISELENQKAAIENEASISELKTGVMGALIEKYGLLKVEEVIEPLYLKDLENLNKERKELELSIEKYSPNLIMKQFEKNLNILMSDLNRIVDVILEISVNMASGCYSFDGKSTEVNLNRKICLKKLTIGNYKQVYIKEKVQKIIMNLLGVSSKNLELLNSAKDQLKISEFTLTVPNIIFERIEFPTDKHIDEKYLIILEKIVYLNESITDVFKRICSIKIVFNEGLIAFGAITRPMVSFSEHYHWTIQPDTYAIVNVSMVKPQFRKYHFTDYLFFFSHSDFKKDQSALNQTIKKINNLNNRNELKENIYSEIISLYSALKNNYFSADFDSVPAVVKSEGVNLPLISYKNHNDFNIDKSDLSVIFGILLKNANLQKNKLFNKSEKCHKRNSITARKVLSYFLLLINRQNLTKKLSLKEIVGSVNSFSSITLETFSKFLVNEEVVGSFKSRTGAQGIIDEKVDENYVYSFENICRDFVFAVCLKNSEKRMELQNIFKSLIKENDEKLLRSYPI